MGPPSISAICRVGVCEKRQRNIHHRVDTLGLPVWSTTGGEACAVHGWRGKGGGGAHGWASCNRSKEAASMTPQASALAGPAYLVSVPSTKKNGTAPSLRHHPTRRA